MTDPTFIPLEHPELSVDEMKRRAAAFLAEIERRRSVRQFSDKPVPRAIIEDCLRAAGTAPSGANQQPWHFVAVADPDVKRQVRQAAEQEEREFYGRRAPEAWLDALAPLGTGPEKPFLERAPWLIVVFVEQYGSAPDEGATGCSSASVDTPMEPRTHAPVDKRPVPPGRSKRYYPVESAAIAAGILITAIHHAGLASLVYTPYRMGFLNEILRRPKNERPLLILVAGHPADDAVVPAIDKKALDQIVTFV